MKRVELLAEENKRKHDYFRLCKRVSQDLTKPYETAVQYLRKDNETTRAKNLKIQKFISEINKILERYTMQQEMLKQHLLEHGKLLKKKSWIPKIWIKKGQFKIEKAHKIVIEIQQDIYEKKLKQIVKQHTEQEQQLQRNHKRLDTQSEQFIERRETLEIKVDKTKADLTLLKSELKILKSGEISGTHKYESKKNSYEKSQYIVKENKIIGHELRQHLLIIKIYIQEKLKSCRELQQTKQDMTALLMKIRAKINEATRISRAMLSCENKAIDF
uniref:Uncharacterized protein n=1 Tax=Glossina brevipalpis TaxID=37001 RepID=A0A1A9WLW6_9MUSC